MSHFKRTIFSFLTSIILCSPVFADDTVVMTPQTTTTKEVVVSAPDASGNTTTTTTTTKKTIVTPAPEAKEVIVTPAGSVSCTLVPAGWNLNQTEWIPAHNVCTYANNPMGVAWIEGYWACTEYSLDQGVCTSWDWRAGHWTKTMENY